MKYNKLLLSAALTCLCAHAIAYQNVTHRGLLTSSLPTGSLGVAYDATVEAAGGTPLYVWRLASGALPEGLTIDAGSGLISGTPAEAGTFSITAEVLDSGGLTADRELDVTVNAQGPAIPATGSWGLLLFLLAIAAAGSIALSRR